MTERTRLARNTPVSICQRLLAIELLVASIDEDILAVMRRSAANPETRVVAITDPAGVVVGVLPVLRLAEAVIARVAPESLLTHINDMADVTRFEMAIEAKVVGDVMLPPATILGEATVDQAFQQMQRRRLSGLVVVDAAGRPTGYLDLLELALLYVDALEAGPAPPPT